VSPGLAGCHVPADRRQRMGESAQLDLGVDHRLATNKLAECDLVHLPRRTNRLTGSCSPRPEAEILEVANGCYRKGYIAHVSRYWG